MVSAYATDHVMGYGKIQSHTYEDQIQQTLDKVADLVLFVQDEHFALGTLHLFWRNDTRAQITVQTIGRLLGRPLAEELHSIKELLERTLPYDIYEFSTSVSPHLFNAVDAIRPKTGELEDRRASVEQYHYAADVRQAVLQHILTILNQRYQTPRFHDLTEASRWTDAYSGTLQAAAGVIQGTRNLLKQEVDAAQQYLRQISRDIEAIEAAAEAKFGIVKRIRWSTSLEEAEHEIHNCLAERASQIEAVTFAVLKENKSSSFLELLARPLSRAPKIGGMLLLGLAGTGLIHTVQKADLTSISVPRLPQPLRGQADPLDTARLTALGSDLVGTRSARYLNDAVSRLVSDVQSRERSSEQGAQVRGRIDQFFNTLGTTPGRQTLVIQSRQELEQLLERLSSHGYQPAEVLSLLGLSSVDAFMHPLTLDMREGREKPILFPYTSDAQMTAPHQAINPSTAVMEPVATEVETTVVDTPSSPGSAETARVATALAPNESYIVYRVQPNEGLADIATRYGTTVTQIMADNHLASEAVARGQNLLIRRPSAPAQQATPAPSGAVTAPQAETPASTTGSESQQSSFIASDRQVLGMSARSMVAPKSAPISGNDVVSQYGDTLFPSLESMPTDARDYLLGTVQEIGSFFNVRPGDILGILRLEQNNAGWRLQEDRVSEAGATGVAQIVARTWNGWANPEQGDYVHNVLEIEKHGGLGFDWSKREEWRAWQEGRADRSALQDSNADPQIFENSVAGVARHLVHWGLTKDFAERDPQGFARRLEDAIAVYNSGRTLDVSGEWVQSSDNHKTTGQYVAEAMATSESLSTVVEQPSIAVAAPTIVEKYGQTFRQLYDRTFGVELSQEEIEQFLSGNPVLFEDARSGKIDPATAAAQLLDQVAQQYMAEGRAAIQAGAERPWPFIHNRETLYAQQSAVNLLGRTLTLYEIDDLMNRTKADRDLIRSELMTRADTRLFVQGKHLFDQLLKRTERGLPVLNSEVAQVVHPLLAGHSPISMDEETLHKLADQLQVAIQSLSEYEEIHGEMRFAAMPLVPMPTVFKDFGVHVDYQAGGKHTGIDVANPRTSDGKEPLLYAVDDATVVHVGPLYCDAPTACRGGKAIVLDHGNHVYSIYSHNSEATVKVGDRVKAGQEIGRQGDEGYSFGSHLHFEVHTGAPFTGDWQQPFKGGQFVDPVEFLPLP